MTRILRLVSLLALALAAACAPAPPPPTPVPPVGEPSGLQRNRPSLVLRVGTSDNGTGLWPHYEIIDEFQKLNPDIAIQVQPIAGDGYYDDLMTEIDAGYAPDIMQIGDDAVARFVKKGALADLGPMIKGNYPLDLNIYLPGVFQPGAWLGKQFLLPKDFSPLAIYYNKKIFDRYEIPYPKDGWTREDFLRTALALTHDLNRDGKPEVWGVQLPANWASGFEFWVAAAGGSLISEDGRTIEGFMDSEATVRALQFYSDLYHKYEVAPPPSDRGAFAGGNREFENGQAAMLVFGHWQQESLRDNPNVSLGIVGMPVDQRRANVLFWSGFGIYSGSPNKEAAWRFLRFYAGTQGAQIWKNWGLPSVRLAVDTAGLSRDPLESIWLRELSYLTPRAYVFSPYWGETGEAALRDALDKIILDPGTEPAAVLKQAARHAQAALDAKK